MGNCLETLFGRKPRRKDYFRGRYQNCDVGIEFENLIEDDGCQADGNAIITYEERELLNDHKYRDLVAAQKKIDAEIDQRLQREEEEIKLEEEAFIAAKREASRIARQKKLIDDEHKANSNGQVKSWLGEDESQWEIAGGQDDFEMFLDSVKARSLAVRANGMLITGDQDTSPPNEKSYSSGKDQTVSSDDASWEGNFVNADMTPEPIVIAAPPVSVGNHFGTTARETEAVSNQTTLKTFDAQPIKKDIPKPVEHAAKTVLDSSLKDFDDFLDELELELDLSAS
ncbi:AP-1 complex-associated regulatory protein-like [Antedon mediterranea]|uniref:AP-1 complex-associated regulatory protein-like n=1 Tax=Antedon mediterranea TaxID=105859 RepID=UPI003AF6D84E